MVKTKKAVVAGVRFSPEDERIANALQKKLGIKALSELVRMALRTLATKEGITL